MFQASGSLPAGSMPTTRHGPSSRASSADGGVDALLAPTLRAPAMADPVRIADYRPPDYAADRIELDFDLRPHGTRVTARTHCRRLAAGPAPLHLHGEGFTTERLLIDGRELGPADYTLVDGGLVLQAPPAQFVLEATTRFDPADNTALSGLYTSGGRFCTQCEAEGFRRITWAQDRPDVLARYTVRLQADRAQFPTLLCNGDLAAAGELPGGRHFATWVDPFPKPTYLFALAAGRFETIRAPFTTRSGRPVELTFHVDPGDGESARFALDCLVRAMRWDEQVFQREYDLSVYQVVAVRDFNFGAMENKGLNIFNSAYVLADPRTATDADYESIEAVIGHEYFHNWTGNRITLRDWFQLSLKEGLTVYREHEFMAATRSAPVQRLKDVRRLRARQFPEDGGPLAHPVRPPSYRAIDNFYTATVYEKGAELVRVLRQIAGDDAFARGLQRYFVDFDGKAATVEDLVGCVAAAAGRDLSGFLRWYDQAGTPVLTVRHRHDPAARTCTLELAQATPPTPGQPHKLPVPIPLCIGLLSASGTVLAARLHGVEAPAAEHRFVLDTERATLVFHGIDAPALPAVLRGCSAPVRLDDGLGRAERLLQMAHDPDPYTRWDAGQRLAVDLLLAAAAGSVDEAAVLEFAGAMARELDRAPADPAFAAQALRLPELGELVQRADAPDPERLASAREQLRRRLASALRPGLLAVASAAPGPPPPAAP
ncbi:MAG: aminopeptidase N, partial [Planctomycetes bacterium]|nr:aminopeptidase N [Planctomycetota bacterium]